MKKRFQGKERRKVVTFNGFSVGKEEKGKLFAAVSYGCECKNGVLRRGVGVEPCLNAEGNEIPIVTNYEVIRVFRIHYYDSSLAMQEKFMVSEGDGLLYQIDDTGKATVSYYMGGPFSYYPVRTEGGKNIHFFAGKTRALYSENCQMFTICDHGPVYGACVLNGRSFIGKEGRTVKYSIPYTLNRFAGTANDGGVLRLPEGEGKIISLETDGEYVYVFLEQEIYRLTVGSDGMKFAVERVEYFGGDICENSMLVTTQGIVFLALSGAYLLRGKTAKRICAHLPIYPSKATNLCTVGCCEDMALIDYKTLNEQGREVTQRLAISLRDNDGYFCDRYGELGGNDLCVIGGVLYKFVKDSPNAEYRVAPSFKTRKLDLGTMARKTIKRLRLEGRGTVSVYAQGAGNAQKRVFHLNGGIKDVGVMLSGKTFDFRIYPEAGAEVRAMQVEYICTEG